MDKTMKEKKAIASTLEPTVRIGRAGLTNAVVDEIKNQLEKKEILKIKILGAIKEEIKTISHELVKRTETELVEIRGNTVTIWQKDGQGDHEV